MELKIDLSLITDEELEALAVWFGRCEVEFQEDEIELSELFQELSDILRSESMARDAGLASVGMKRFALLGKDIFESSALLCLAKIACKIANDYRSRSVFGNSLLLALMV